MMDPDRFFGPLHTTDIVTPSPRPSVRARQQPARILLFKTTSQNTAKTEDSSPHAFLKDRCECRGGGGQSGTPRLPNPQARLDLRDRRSQGALSGSR